MLKSLNDVHCRCRYSEEEFELTVPKELLATPDRQGEAEQAGPETEVSCLLEWVMGGQARLQVGKGRQS